MITAQEQTQSTGSRRLAPQRLLLTASHGAEHLLPYIVSFGNTMDLLLTEAARGTILVSSSPDAYDLLNISLQQ